MRFGLNIEKISCLSLTIKDEPFTTCLHLYNIHKIPIYCSRFLCICVPCSVKN